jgi:hypothetical protein
MDEKYEEEKPKTRKMQENGEDEKERNEMSKR